MHASTHNFVCFFFYHGFGRKKPSYTWTQYIYNNYYQCLLYRFYSFANEFVRNAKESRSAMANLWTGHLTMRLTTDILLLHSKLAYRHCCDACVSVVEEKSATSHETMMRTGRFKYYSSIPLIVDSWMMQNNRKDTHYDMFDSFAANQKILIHTKMTISSISSSEWRDFDRTLVVQNTLSELFIDFRRIRWKFMECSRRFFCCFCFWFDFILSCLVFIDYIIYYTFFWFENSILIKCISLHNIEIIDRQVYLSLIMILIRRWSRKKLVDDVRRDTSVRSSHLRTGLPWSIDDTIISTGTVRQ